MILNHFDPKVLEVVLLMSATVLLRGRGIPLKPQGSHQCQVNIETEPISAKARVEKVVWQLSHGPTRG